MTLPRWCDKLAAMLRRDLLTSLRHRRGFLVHGVSLGAELAGAYYLARAIGPSFRPDGMGYYPFLLVGTAFMTFVVAGVASFVAAIQEAQTTGSIEVLMSTATRPSTILMLSALSSFFGRAFTMIGYLAVGALVAAGAFRPNLGAAVVVFGLSLVVAVAIGILAASVQLWMQKGAAVVWLFGTLAWLLTGTAFPVSALPVPLQRLTAAIPLTYSIRGLRLALLENAGLAAVWGPVVALLISAAVLLPLSLLVFRRVGRAARLDGTLSFY